MLKDLWGMLGGRRGAYWCQLSGADMADCQHQEASSSGSGGRAELKRVTAVCP